MEQRIIINLGEGSWQHGFPHVIAQLWEVGQSTPNIQRRGRLLANSDLEMLYRRWQSLYKALNSSLGLRQSMPTAIEIDNNEDEAISRISKSEFENLCEELEEQFNHWLDVSSFASVEQALRTHLDLTRPIQVIIEAEDSTIRRFPWHLWDFFSDYCYAEVSVGNFEHKKLSTVVKKAHHRVRILSILGDTTGIQVKKDRELLNRLDAEVFILDERSRTELDQHLWDKEGWDILFFSGHSETYAGGDRGKIKLNITESISIKELKYALKKALQRGLQLAIFNSCDGMGLARELGELDIPYLVVMREPVPDQVAQSFLMHFLNEFSAGTSFPLAVRDARERLQGLEGTFPCASWLPVICQSSGASPFKWRKLTEEFEHGHPLSVNAPEILNRHNRIAATKISFSKVFLLTLLTTFVVMCIRFFGFLEPLELLAYDHLLRLRPHESPPSNILIVAATATDLTKYGSDRIEDGVLAKVIDKLEEHDPAVIGIDLYRAEPSGSELERQELIQKFQENSNLFTICKYQAATPALKTPSEFLGNNLNQQVGFSNFEIDGHKAAYSVRRHLLAYNLEEAISTNRCSANSLSLILAATYLSHQGVTPLGYQIDIDNNLRLGETVFKRLSVKEAGRFGGYQNLDGHDEIMLNYRQPKGNKVPFHLATLADILEDEVTAKRIQNKIVLIGTISPDSKDIHNTPYGSMYGVEIHAHMVSQLIESTQNNRPVIWTLHAWRSLQWGDILWVFLWSLISGLVVSSLYPQWMKTLIAFIVIESALYVTCFVFMLNAGWMPLVPSVIAVFTTFMLIVLYGVRKSSFRRDRKKGEFQQ
ncbi:MAG: CHASE2 domain-containing protein [Cyanobacteria bacterium P01_F01_bin.56]